MPDPRGVGEGRAARRSPRRWRSGRWGRAGDRRTASSSPSCAAACFGPVAARRRRTSRRRVGGAPRRPLRRRPPRWALASWALGSTSGSGAGSGPSAGATSSRGSVSGSVAGGWAGEQAEGVGEFADQYLGHGLAVDLAGLVAGGHCCAGDHGEPDLHRRTDPGPQDQVGQAIDHPLVFCPLVPGRRAVLGVGLQRPPAGLRDRQRSTAGSAAMPSSPGCNRTDRSRIAQASRFAAAAASACNTARRAASRSWATVLPSARASSRASTSARASSLTGPTISASARAACH